MLLFRYHFFFSSRRRHTRCALVTGVQTCALPIYALGNIRQGDPLDPATQLGAQASTMQMEKIESYLALAIEEGATVFAGGARSADAGLAKGHFVQPTIFKIGRAWCRESVCQYV